MKKIVYSCLGKSDEVFKDCIEILLSEHDKYKKEYQVVILTDEEVEIFGFMLETYNNSQSMPNLSYLVQWGQSSGFPDINSQYNVSQEIDVSDIRSHTFNILRSRIKKGISGRISDLNSKIKRDGLSDKIFEELTKLKNLNDSVQDIEIVVDLDSKSIYEEMKKRPGGMVTGIKEVDDRIGGMNIGTVTTIAGFTSHFKSTWALNIAHRNAYHSGYNIAYISLETPKEDMNWNLLSRHSYETKFTKMPYVGHDKMRKCKMSQAEEDFIFNEVDKDFRSPFTDCNGNIKNRGKIVFLDESDFTSFSFTEIDMVLSKVDEELEGGLDAVIVDYIQLCKFSGSGMTYDANSQINSYVTFFRRLSQSFGSGDNKKQIAVILLSQINRTTWAKAKNNGGRYDLTCLADANELERGSHRVLTTFTNEEMKGRNAAQVQILKNRNGSTMYDPETVYVQGDAYVYKDEIEGANTTFGGNPNGFLEALDDTDFDSIDGLGSFGI